MEEQKIFINLKYSSKYMSDKNEHENHKAR